MRDFKKVGEYVQSISETYRFKSNEEVVFLNTSDIYNGQVLNKTPQNSHFLPGQAKKRIQKEDFLFSEIRPANGRFAKVDFNPEKYVVSTKLMVLRCNPEIDIDYFRFFLTSKNQLDYLQMLAEDRSGTFPQITFDNISNLDIFLPSLSEQKAIAGVLSSLDDKIDLLHRQNKTLEAMAETLFRQWFIEEAEDDWGIYKVKDFVQHIKITIKPQDNPQNLFLHYSIPAFDNNQNPSIERGKDIRSNKYKVVKNSLLVSKLNPITPRIWAILSLKDLQPICSTEFQVLKPQDSKQFGFFYFLFNSASTISELAMAASGTSGSHQRVTPSDILNISFSVPSLDALNNFSNLVIDFLNKVEQNRESILNLEKQRNLLLPKLMSGEVRVKYD